MHVLLLDAEKRWSVPVVRALGRRGIRVLAASTDPWAPGGRSRFSAGRLRCPPAENARFAEWVVDTVRREGLGMVLALTEETIAVLLRHRDGIERHAVLPYPEEAAFGTARDKALATRTAEEVGLAVPRTESPDTVEEGSRALDRLGYPCVVKPRVSSGSRGLAILRGPGEAHRLAEVRRRHGPVLVQEVVPNGGGLGLSLLYDREGRARAGFAHRRLREFPASGGTCTLAESIADPALEEGARRLLERIGWRGVAMVEFRVDARDGIPRFLEVNPRFWGSVALPIAAGVDFPYLLWAAEAGMSFPRPAYRVGVRARFVPGEVIRFLSGPHRLRMGPGLFGSDHAEVHNFVPWRGDPWPSVAMIAGDLRRALRGGGIRSFRRARGA